ncbi:MAG: hypothetical protein J6B16_05085 [Clostridia bacterium]|nr:hypothetical protein [Clostridia bacterium]
MRDIILYTKNPINYDECVKNILEKVKSATTNSKNYFHSNNKHFWCLDIDNEDLESSLLGFDVNYVEEQKQLLIKNVPIENPISNLLQTHRSIDAKRIIEVLMKLYPELYIEVNDAEIWFGSAQEYLDMEFDY